ncbi:hypothetical protein EPO05_01180 [Patescibacteria group bacterium]|nr:MAG: hypothetical protein EPO05_01180 [Patescibacteria group bacterium]
MKIKQAQVVYFVFAGLLIFGFAVLAMAEDHAASTQNVFQDADQDGLSDEEERVIGADPLKKDTDGDGYSDGAEIKSGYDPLKPAPGDRLVSTMQAEAIGQVAGVSTEGKADSTAAANTEAGQAGEQEKNLTNVLSAKIATLVQEKKDVSINDVDSVISETMAKDVTFEDLPEVDPALIKIKKQDYGKLSEAERIAKEREDALKYLTAVGYILLNNAPTKITSMADLSNLSSNFQSQALMLISNFSNASYFSQFEGMAKNVTEQLSVVEVPQQFISLHIKGLKLAKYGETLKDKIRPNPNDPVASIVGFSEARGFALLLGSFGSEVQSEFEKLGIKELPIEL